MLYVFFLSDLYLFKSTSLGWNETAAFKTFAKKKELITNRTAHRQPVFIFLSSWYSFLSFSFRFITFPLFSFYSALAPWTHTHTHTYIYLFYVTLIYFQCILLGICFTHSIAKVKYKIVGCLKKACSVSCRYLLLISP